MKNNEIIKIKTLMFYDTKKTLLENKSKVVVQENLIQRLAQQSRNLPDFTKALESVVNMGKSQGKEIMVLDAKTKIARPVTDVNDLLRAINYSRIEATELARLQSGLLKSATTPANMLDDIVRELVRSDKFVNTYSKFKNEKEIVAELTRKGYSPQSIAAIEKELQYVKFKPNKSFINPALKQKIMDAVTKGWTWQKIVATFGVLASIPTIWSIVKGTGTPPQDTPPKPPQTSSGGSSGGGRRNPMQYHNCSNKSDNFEFGCISPMIAQIQACRGIKPAKGYFGPITRKNLNVDVITKDLYDKIMADCGQTSSSDSVNVKDITSNPNLAYKPTAKPGQFTFNPTAQSKEMGDKETEFNYRQLPI